MPDTWALVPIKSLDNGKTRLAPVLSPEERAALISAMVQDVLDAFSQFGGMPVLVVTGDPRVARLAAEYGFQALMEETCVSETKAIEAATAWAAHRGAAGVLVVPADVPLVRPGDLAELIDCAPDNGSLLVPAWDGRGTNAVLERPCDLFPLRFGNDSFAPHHAAARATGLPCVVRQNERLALDVDSPKDLSRFLKYPSSTRTRRVLEALDVEGRRP